jgi:hypothetical protein
LLLAVIQKAGCHVNSMLVRHEIRQSHFGGFLLLRPSDF